MSEVVSAVRELRHGDAVELRFVRTTLHTSVLLELRRQLLVARDEALPLVITSSHPSIFLAGAHLQQVRQLDRAGSGAYARLGRETIRMLAQHPAPVVAAVGGACAGGGTDLALGCDRVVVGPRASMLHPGARRGLVTGWGGTAMLPPRAGRSTIAAMLLQTSALGADELVASGLACAVHESPAEAAFAEVRRLAAMDPSRLSLWRALRHGRFVDRFRAVMVHNQRRPMEFSSAIRRS